MASGIYTACLFLLFASIEGFLVDDRTTTPHAHCLNSQVNCDFLNLTYAICSNVQLAKEQCQLFCHLCDAVDGHWSVWGQWSGCDVSCGNGTRLRARSCDNPAPAQGGDNCVGPKHDQDVCVLQTCPVHGAWSGWTAWGSCSTSCGVGLQRRDRSCDNPWPSKDGNHCNGDSINYRVCADALCTDGWDNWSIWSSCSVTCGQGLKQRQRMCNDTMGTMLGGGCIGNNQEQMECNMTPCDMAVIFYADNPRDKVISYGEKIVYRTAKTNKGSGYNAADGVFTAPHEGLYLFTSQTCVNPSQRANTAISKDGVWLQAALMQDSGSTCNSMQVVAELHVGANVWIEGVFSSNIVHENNYRCSFSGILIN